MAWAREKLEASSVCLERRSRQSLTRVVTAEAGHVQSQACVCICLCIFAFLLCILLNCIAVPSAR